MNQNFFDELNNNTVTKLEKKQINNTEKERQIKESLEKLNCFYDRIIDEYKKSLIEKAKNAEYQIIENKKCIRQHIHFECDYIIYAKKSCGTGPIRYSIDGFAGTDSGKIWLSPDIVLAIKPKVEKYDYANWLQKLFGKHVYCEGVTYEEDYEYVQMFQKKLKNEFGNKIQIETEIGYTYMSASESTNACHRRFRTYTLTLYY